MKPFLQFLLVFTLVLFALCIFGIGPFTGLGLIGTVFGAGISVIASIVGTLIGLVFGLFGLAIGMFAMVPLMIPMLILLSPLIAFVLVVALIVRTASH
jgi:hypothetical protein